jgi:hypothetical protein
VQQPKTADVTNWLNETNGGFGTADA